MKVALAQIIALLLAPLPVPAGSPGAGIPSLALCGPDGSRRTLDAIGELPEALAGVTGDGDIRVVVAGRHELREALHLSVRVTQRLILEGGTDEAVLELGALPMESAAVCLEGGSFELRGLALHQGPAWSVQVSGGVCYQLRGLRIRDARGGGIVVWGPCGVDQAGQPGNRIEGCVIGRYNTAGAKWTHDGISVRDNGAVIARNIIRDSPTETMGIRVMGAGNHIEGNLVEHVATGDAGGIYLWAGEAIYAAVGNVVSNNIVAGASRGIYLDDGTCAARVEGNYVVDCREAAVFIGGGRDNRADRNVALRCPILAHVDNRRVGWRDLPEKAAMFSAARTRLADALRDPAVRARVAEGGLDVRAFETLDEPGFNKPAGNRVTRNILMPPALEIRWQNYARPDQPLRGAATDPDGPNRMAPAPDGDWRKLSLLAPEMASIPAVTDILKALPKP